MEITVIGSLNMDLVVKTDRAPEAGETLKGGPLNMICGGKGANQAAAMGKLNCKVRMVGTVGADAFGSAILNSLSDCGVSIAHVVSAPDVITGTAMIMVEKSGENRILISAGANDKTTPESVERAIETLSFGDLCVFQFEIPTETVFDSIPKASNKGAHIIFNPAPMKPIPGEILNLVDYLIVNETEAAAITGLPSDSEELIRAQAKALLSKNVGCVIITLGEAGAFYANGHESAFVPAYKIDAVDTTASGDAFIGGFCFALTKNFSLLDAVRVGCAAGAITATRAGAQPSLPTEAELKKFLSERSPSQK